MQELLTYFVTFLLVQKNDKFILHARTTSASLLSNLSGFSVPQSSVSHNAQQVFNASSIHFLVKYH
jgi:hypothetical protein